MKRRAGFTLLEVLIAAAVSAVVLAAVFTVIFTTVRQDESLRVQMEMQIEASRAMKEITSLLKQSGPVDVDRDNAFDANVDWPVFTTDVLAFEPRPAEGVTLPPGTFPGSQFDGLNRLLTPPYKLSVNGDPTYTPENLASVEMAFRLPEDANGDGYPTDTSGGIEWSTDIYVLCHEARSPVEWLENGNVLELRRYNPLLIDPVTGNWTLVERKILAHWVERVLFESRNNSFYQTDNYDPSLGVDQLRLTIWFRRNDISRQRERQISIKTSGTVMFRSVDR